MASSSVPFSWAGSRHAVPGALVFPARCRPRAGAPGLQASPPRPTGLAAVTDSRLWPEAGGRAPIRQEAVPAQAQARRSPVARRGRSPSIISCDCCCPAPRSAAILAALPLSGICRLRPWTNRDSRTRQPANGIEHRSASCRACVNAVLHGSCSSRRCRLHLS